MPLLREEPSLPLSTALVTSRFLGSPGPHPCTAPMLLIEAPVAITIVKVLYMNHVSDGVCLSQEAAFSGLLRHVPAATI